MPKTSLSPRAEEALQQRLIRKIPKLSRKAVIVLDVLADASRNAEHGRAMIQSARAFHLRDAVENLLLTGKEQALGVTIRPYGADQGKLCDGCHHWLTFEESENSIVLMLAMPSRFKMPWMPKFVKIKGEGAADIAAVLQGVLGDRNDMIAEIAAAEANQQARPSTTSTRRKPARVATKGAAKRARLGKSGR